MLFDNQQQRRSLRRLPFLHGHVLIDIPDANVSSEFVKGDASLKNGNATAAEANTAGADGMFSDILRSQQRKQTAMPQSLPPIHRPSLVQQQPKAKWDSPLLGRPAAAQSGKRPSVVELYQQATSEPVAALEPKVMLPFVPNPNETPRRVEIERRKKLYSQQKLEQLISSEGVVLSSTDVGSVDGQQPKIVAQVIDANSGLSTEKCALDLKDIGAFDNYEFDERTPEEWIRIGSIVPGSLNASEQALLIDAKGFIFDPKAMKYQWTDGYVISYSHQNNLWRFKIQNSDIEHWLPKVFVYFRTENPWMFAKRFKYAIFSCLVTETEMAKEIALEKAVTGEAVPKWMASNIQKRLGQSNKLQAAQINISSLLGEVGKYYNLSLRKIEDNVRGAEEAVDRKSSDRQQKQSVDTAALGQQLIFASIYSKTEIFQIMCDFREECLKLIQVNPFMINFSKAVRLEEFEQLQIQSLSNFKSKLRESWIENLKNILKIGLRDIGKGWFNVKESNIETYRMIKLSRVMTVVKLIMQDTLRSTCQRALMDYLNIFSQASSGNGSSIKSLFLVDILVKDGVAVSNVDYHQFEKTLVGIIDKFLETFRMLPSLEPMIVDQIFWVYKPVLEIVTPEDHLVVQAKETLRTMLNEAFQQLHHQIHQYKAYESRIKLDLGAFSAEYESVVDRPIEEVEADVKKHSVEMDGLEKEIVGAFNLAFFWVNAETVRLSVRKDIAKCILDIQAKKAAQYAQQISREYHEVMTTLKARPNSVEELTRLRDFISTIPEIHSQQHEKTALMLRIYDLLDRQRYLLPAEDFRNKWQAIGWPKRIQDQQMQTEMALKTDEVVFLKGLKADQENLSEKARQLRSAIAEIHRVSDLAKLTELVMEVQRITTEIKECQQLCQLYNSRERLFKLDSTKYDEIVGLDKEFEPYRNLWLTTQDWINWRKAWMYGPFIKIDPDQIEKDLATALRVMVKSVKLFKDQSRGYADLSQKLKQEIEDFKTFLPIIQGLRNPGMRDRHWERIQEETGLELKSNDTQTLEYLLQLNVMQRTEPLLRVCEFASKEYAIESALLKIDESWKGIVLDTLPYRETGTFICKIPEEIVRMIDDHITMVQSMSFSPFKKPFKELISEWDERLRLVQEIVECVMECQRLWLYLEPIFTSDDISTQLPAETKKFMTVDRFWRKFMQQAQDKHLLIDFFSEKKLLENLIENIKIAEVVSKGLSSYLDSKRLAFPRFFFLSDDELLQILSQTKNPLSVQPHLRKCFENVAQLIFDDQMTIKAMVAADGEVCPLTEPFQPQGPVEQWLLKVEKAMKSTIRDTFRSAIVDYLKTPRTEWVSKWPGQVVIGTGQTYWTKQVTEAIAESSLQKLHGFLNGQLQELVALIRRDISPVLRLVLEQLIVIEVHARDVVQKLIDCRVETVSDFEWMSQLRYYWENDELIVKIINARFQYGNEYLGNTGRLVITPLTDRCYLTLTMAMNLNLGGAPQGPAGTGKTETTKDLAKALAKQCVVFNCSGSLDYLAMAKFFKGLASAGAWACFDEFNLLNIEVLSVISQQIMTIQKAVAANQERFMFEGVELNLDPSFAVFITMNPGYAGRSELPDNLKALFRPVAMMIPDYCMIAEISLYSFGFFDARILAQKIVATFKLSSEQLSSQQHYDFGMRAVKAVIASAGSLKRQCPDIKEDVLLLRALFQCNMPKFLAEDIPLFNGIIGDLFPGVPRPVDENAELRQELSTSAKSLGLQPSEHFVNKCMQVYETLLIRHGMMLVGQTGGGKSSAWKALSRALSTLNSRQQEQANKVQTYPLNPKSITLGQLYGEFDQQTHEWTDGVIACLVRQGVEDTTADWKWYIFDGPVDAAWIESMNTVLDDNKKLCLSSGEIIKLTPQQRLMFEVGDLAHASPATVSRCGMVYFEPSAIGADMLLQSWVDKVTGVYANNEEISRLITKLADCYRHYVPASISHIRDFTKEVVRTSDSGLITSLLRIVSTLLADLSKSITQDDVSESRLSSLDSVVENIFIFSLLWSVGGALDAAGRKSFEAFLRERSSGRAEAGLAARQQASLYDRYYDLQQNEWVSWIDLPSKQTAGSVAEQQQQHLRPDSIIRTVDTCRYSFFLEMAARSGFNLLLAGPTGTGKTSIVIQKLMREMPASYIPVVLNFSARTRALQTQDFVFSKLSKRRKGVFGPQIGSKILLFIDDLNMPAAEQTGTQPPIELIRQLADHGGWYDRQQAGRFNEIVDLSLISSMGPPGGGRPLTSARLLRHYNILSVLDLDQASMKTILGTVLGSFLEVNRLDFGALVDPLLEASINIYETIRAELLPTPAKSHYTYNMRDLSKVFRGMLSADPKNLSTQSDFIRLWCHESLRVFQDRLVDQTDRDWFDGLLKTNMLQKLQVNWEDIVQQEPLIYGDFLIPGADPKSYQEIRDMKRLHKVVEEYLDDFNSSTTTSSMKLIMFIDAIEHLARICRIIRQGHALLLGVGGSGRQSLAKLAAFMEEYEIFQIEVSKNYGLTEWREDLKRILLQAGVEGKQISFIFSDNQIFNDSCLEDINNILNNGDVPNLFRADDLDRITTAMKAVAQEEGSGGGGKNLTKEALYTLFLQRVRKYLRLTVCMSPMSDAFRNRLRMFPALVNCCTIDWFQTWPEEALRSVAASAVAEIPEVGSEDVVESIVRVCVYMHESVRKKCVQYKSELNRISHVTPKSYLELIALFRKLLDMKRTELITLKRRTATGLDKLLSASADVEVLQTNLASMQPQLLAASQETESTMKKIAADKSKAEEIREVISKEESVASKKAEETKAIASDAQRDLDEALPALDAALESLKCLTKNDVIEVRSMQRPPDGVKMVIEAVCIMKGIKPKRVDAADKSGKKVDDYWEPGKALLADPAKFLESLFNFDKDNIPEQTIQKIKPYIDNADFQPAAIARVSKASTSMCQWVRAMEKYYHVSRSVEPKRQRLKEAQEQLDVTMRNLAEQKAKMTEIQSRIEEMEIKFAESVARKEELGRKVDECNVKLSRAEKLIVGLANERGRWATTVDSLERSLINVVGDVLISSGVIAYLGPFTVEFRASLVQEWVQQMKRLSRSESISLVEILGNPVKIRQCEMFGLPKDSFSRENSVIVQYSRRWPLFVDPQGQANKWLRNMERDAGLEIIKLTDKDFLRTLENCIRFGKPCLLENIGEKLDPALEPVLLKQTFKQGNALVIKLGDSIIPMHEEFRLYLTTKLSNPRYSPETMATVTVINFTLAPSGLEDQLLAMVVANERPDLEEAKNNLIVSNANMKKELKEIEDKVLFLLSSVQGSPVDDERLIETLAASKKTSEEIQLKVAVAEQTEKEIDITRNQYVPVAIRTRLLFTCINELSAIDPMYQYSLGWFMGLFKTSLVSSAKADEIAVRIQNIVEHFTFSLYSNVCRSLFEKHKLLFAFLLSVKILLEDQLIDVAEWKFLVAGGSIKSPKPNPYTEWLPARAWNECLAMSQQLQTFSGLDERLEEYRVIVNHSSPEREKFPIWEQLSDFQKLLVLRGLRPDRLTIAIQLFIESTLGYRFVEPQTGDLSVVYKESNSITPIIFVLSPGVDPADNFYKLAEDMRFSKKSLAISLGQGQGARAENLLKEGMERGFWVLLQNCHLCPSWMPSLEKIMETVTADKVHRDFRLWLTSMPTERFPVPILQTALKVTLEPPRGLKANLWRTYSGFNEDFLQNGEKTTEWRKLLFSLSFFHAIVQERRKFGPLGWNIPYEFTDSDLRICVRQLRIFINEYDVIPYKVLKFTAGDINYGGRITDDWDRRVIMNVLNDFYSESVLQDGFKFSASDSYYSCPAGSYQDYLNYIKALPMDEPAEAFSMDTNANITFAQKEAFAIFDNLVSLMPKAGDSSGGSAKSSESILADAVESIINRLPKQFDVAKIVEKYPPNYHDSMTTVLAQEAVRYNNVLALLDATLRETKKAIKGLVAMSEQTESICNSILVNTVPAIWSSKSYPSLKPLASWLLDLEARVRFFQDWIQNGQPAVFWLPGFYFPQAFMTAVLQNYSRKHSIAIDQLSFGFNVMDYSFDSKTAPENGCYIRGLYLEGAGWDENGLQISKPAELFVEMPFIHIVPVPQKKPLAGVYKCPLYKTLARSGTLSTTGHSTNYIMTIELLTSKPEAFWIKRGVAMFCALNF